MKNVVSPEPRHSRLAKTDPLLSRVRQAHERVRLFCNVLEVLVDDLAQFGREKMAVSLLDFATNEMVSFLQWEADELMAPVSHLCPSDGVARLLFEEFSWRHRSVVEALPAVAKGLETLSRGQLPERPYGFIVEALRFSEMSKRYLEWQSQEFLPFAAEAASQADIAGLNTGAASRQNTSLGSNEYRARSRPSR